MSAPWKYVQLVMGYVSSQAYKTQANFQRYIERRAEFLSEQGIEVYIMK